MLLPGQATCMPSRPASRKILIKWCDLAVNDTLQGQSLTFCEVITAMHDLALRWHVQNGTGAHGNTPLHLAASAGHLPIVKALLVAGADAVRASARLLHGFPR